MPRLSRESASQGPWAGSAPTATVAPRHRYGPKPPALRPGDSRIAYSVEADGHVATCRVCGWLTWFPVLAKTQSAAAEHSCRKGLRCLACGAGVRLGDSSCKHYPTQPKENR